MRKKTKDAVRCPQKGCHAFISQEEHAYFCDVCKTKMPDEGLVLRVFRNDRDDCGCDDYEMCSWECFFRKMSKVRHVDFVGLPLASADRRGRNRFLELKRFVKPLLVETLSTWRSDVRSENGDSR